MPRLATRASPRAEPFPVPPSSSRDSGKIPANASSGALSDFSGVSADSVDDRSADEVTAAKEAVLEAEHAPFVRAILEKSLSTSVVVAAMGDAAEEVRDAALSVARAAVSGDAANGKAADLLAALASASADERSRAEQRFKEVNQAYSVLSDARRRAAGFRLASIVCARVKALERDFSTLFYFFC